MSVSPDAAEFIVAEWSAALADAGVDDADHHLIVCAGASLPGRVKAVSFDPGKELTGDPGEGGIVVEPEKLAEANAPENLFRYRVAVFRISIPRTRSRSRFWRAFCATRSSTASSARPARKRLSSTTSWTR
jgi:hypothetical protein